MIRKSITPEQVVKFFNSLLRYDRHAVSQLFNVGVPCNKKLANHSTVQVRVPVLTKRRHRYVPHRVAALGIINGMFGVHDSGKWKGAGSIRRIVSDSGRILRFEVVK